MGHPYFEQLLCNGCGLRLCRDCTLSIESNLIVSEVFLNNFFLCVLCRERISGRYAKNKYDNERCVIIHNKGNFTEVLFKRPNAWPTLTKRLRRSLLERGYNVQDHYYSYMDGFYMGMRLETACDVPHFEVYQNHMRTSVIFGEIDKESIKSSFHRVLGYNVEILFIHELLEFHKSRKN
jgi:hypothetical protein